MNIGIEGARMPSMSSLALKESEQQFRRLAQYDSLTGLPNRSLSTTD